MSEGFTNWKTLHKKESWGIKNFGIEIRVAVDRDLNDNDSRATYRIMDELENVLLRESMRLDAAEIAEATDEREKLMACFPTGEKIFVKEIPNGYCSRWCCSMKPWYTVTTTKGVVTLGWRKRVIEISWEPNVTGARTADALFPGEDVTKIGCLIHAWSYEKAKQYLAKILA
jgi:hypothetical protein